MMVTRQTSEGGWDLLEMAEVKATSAPNPETVDLSLCERQKAIEMGAKYVVYRVCGVPLNNLDTTTTFRIIEIVDPVGHVNAGRLRRSLG